MGRIYFTVFCWIAAFLFGFIQLLKAENVHFHRLRNDELVFGNQYVQAIFDPQSNQILGLYGDFEGRGNFTVNSLSKPFHLSINGQPNEAKSSAPEVSSYVSPTKDKLTVTKEGIQGMVEEQWSFSVGSQSREIIVSIKGRAVADITAQFLSYGFYVNSPALYAFFDSGVMQMMDHSASCLGSEENFQRAFFLGDGSSLEIVLDETENIQEKPKTVVFRSDVLAKNGYRAGLELQVAGERYPQLSKAYYGAWSPLCWDPLLKNETRNIIPKDTTWTLTMNLLPNDGNFPTYTVRDVVDAQNLGNVDNMRSHLLGIYPSAAGCLQSYYTNQMGIAAPTISHPDVGYSPNTNFFDPDNFMTMSAMLYAGDAYLTMQVKQVLQRTATTMCGLGSGQDPKYCSQMRQRLGRSQRPYHSVRHRRLHTNSQSTLSSSESSLNTYSSVSRAGQLMHHFISLSPTYESIAGSEQLGPNIFWTLTAIRYISISQDRSFALEMFPYIDLSAKFILSFVDTEKMLVEAPGPLWIDVLVREHFASDSSAMLVQFLPQLADFYDLMHLLAAPSHPCSDCAETAVELRSLAENIAQAMVSSLWVQDETQDDHLVTQIDADGVVRDFVDYDSNLLAVAAGVFHTPHKEVSEEMLQQKMKRLLSRVDSGNHTHIRATWCSEKAYTGDRCDCYIVGGSVCGDSVVTLARIGWVDALARHRLRDTDTFSSLILQPLQRDLLKSTWLSERYDAEGTMIRTAFYFEYPALVTMLLREVSLGLAVGPTSVTIDPIFKKISTDNDSTKSDVSQVWRYVLGSERDTQSLAVDLSQLPQRVSLRLPGDTSADVSWPRQCVLHQLQPMSLYRVTKVHVSSGVVTEQEVSRTDKNGILRFTATFNGETTFVIEQKV